MTAQQKKWLMRSLGVLAIGVLAFIAFQIYQSPKKADNLISSNGRIEAVEIDVAPRMPGRVKDILVREGDFVKAGQIVACMDTDVLDAQYREAKARLLQAESNVAIARSQLAQRESEKAAVVAEVKQREAELEVAEKRLARSKTLAAEGATSQQEADDDYARYQSAIAAHEAALARVQAAEAVIVTASDQIVGAESAVKAEEASLERIQADIKDSELISPRDGRVQYRIAQPGEVVAAGGRVLSLVDLSDVYMTFFLPTAYAGKIAIGDEVRLVLDATPQFVIPAKVSFVSDVAQFTPKTVETKSEREKLMFRIRAQIPKELLKKNITHVKTGLPGMAYLRLDSKKPWPPNLKATDEFP